jgi:hypothetical protein
VRHLLVPSLRSGHVVILDRRNVHRGAAIQALIAGAGCRRLLWPSYSPDVTPIEQAFATITTQLRAVEARTFETLLTAIGHATTPSPPLMPAVASPPGASPGPINSLEARARVSPVIADEVASTYPPLQGQQGLASGGVSHQHPVALRFTVEDADSEDVAA